MVVVVVVSASAVAVVVAGFETVEEDIVAAEFAYEVVALMAAAFEAAVVAASAFVDFDEDEYVDEDPETLDRVDTLVHHLDSSDSLVLGYIDFED